LKSVPKMKENKRKTITVYTSWWWLRQIQWRLRGHLTFLATTAGPLKIHGSHCRATESL